MWLFGDFNGWNKYEFPFERLQFGKWEIKLKPDGKRGCRVPHLSKLKLAIKTPSGEVVDRSFFLQMHQPGHFHTTSTHLPYKKS